MALKCERLDTWVASLPDKPGALAAKLDTLATVGVNLEFIIARRAPEKPGTGVVFVTPIRGAKACRAAQKAGFRRTKSLHTIRIEGPDRKGEGARITSALAEAGLNLRGLSAAAFGRRFLAHVAVDTTADAAKVVRCVRGL